MYKDVPRVTPFSKAQTLETIAEIYAAKLKDDGEQDAAGSAHTATRCNTLHHAAIRCHTLRHAATRCNVLQDNTRRCIKLASKIGGSHTHCNALQRTATHRNIM